MIKSTIEPYVYREYPKMKYHPNGKDVTVEDYDAERALGEDWYDSPTAAAEALETLRQNIAAGAAQAAGRHDGK